MKAMSSPKAATMLSRVHSIERQVTITWHMLAAGGRNQMGLRSGMWGRWKDFPILLSARQVSNFWTLERVWVNDSLFVPLLLSYLLPVNAVPSPPWNFLPSFACSWSFESPQTWVYIVLTRRLPGASQLASHQTHLEDRGRERKRERKQNDTCKVSLWNKKQICQLISR